jgi:hypothetical protein
MKKLINGKSLIVLSVLLVIFTSMGVFAIVNFININNNSKNQTNDKSSMYLDINGKAEDGLNKPKTTDQILSELKKAQVNVTDKISSSVSFTSGTKGSSGSWVVENLASNNVIMQCEIFQDEKLLAKSVPIYPNEHIETINVLESLSPGTYNVVAYINYYKLDTKEYISKAGYKIKLIVQ